MFTVNTYSVKVSETIFRMCFFRLSEHKLRVVIPRLFPHKKFTNKKPAIRGWFSICFWSAREDLNLRPPTPHVRALNQDIG